MLMALNPEQFEIVKTLNGKWPVDRQITWLRIHRIDVEQFGWGTPSPAQQVELDKPKALVEQRMEGDFPRR
jgi:hypothetical protein